MPRKSIGRYVPTPEKKEHYRLLHIWLKLNKEIEFRKLSPFGFEINTATVPLNKMDEFISIVSFDEK